MSNINLENIQNATILIVDDNATNILLLEKLLKISGYHNIQSTTDSQQVLSLYQTNRPDILLIDLKMPGLDGFQVMEQLKAVQEDDYLPVIMITAQCERENRLKALNIGVTDFIGKPFDHAEVIMRIRNMLEIRMLHKEVREQNRRLEEKVQERTRELYEAQVELIHRLVLTTEFRDKETGNHIERIGRYVYELGKKAGLEEEYCTFLTNAAKMHDIGKISIADEILLKPGFLTAEEWEIMKSHTVNGAMILTGSSSRMIKMAEEIAMSHHEKWDGSGYPQGLRGEEIPLAGRITAICDVFDALISERPYKNDWDLEEVIKEIEMGAGTHFDPSLVAHFLEIMPVILEIKEAAFHLTH